MCESGYLPPRQSLVRSASDRRVTRSEREASAFRSDRGPSLPSRSMLVSLPHLTGATMPGGRRGCLRPPPTSNDVLDGHVALDLECVDRIYFNAYVPNLPVGGHVAPSCVTIPDIRSPHRRCSRRSGSASTKKPGGHASLRISAQLIRHEFSGGAKKSNIKRSPAATLLGVQRLVDRLLPFEACIHRWNAPLYTVTLGPMRWPRVRRRDHHKRDPIGFLHGG